MKFDLLLTMAQLPTATQRQVYADAVRYARVAESCGYGCVWLLEHHFSRYSLSSSPLAMAGFILGHTERLEVGTAISVAPLHNPIELAETVSTLDQLSHGRFNFGIGRGSAATDYRIFGVDPTQNHQRLREWTDILRAAWTAETVAWDSDAIVIPEVPVYPEPYSDPHPPLFVAADSPGTIEFAAGLGVPLLLPHWLEKATLASHIELYRAFAGEHGHDPDPGHVLSAVAWLDDDGIESAVDAVMPTLEWWVEVGTAWAWTLEDLRSMPASQWHLRRWEESIIAGDETKARLRKMLRHNALGTRDDCARWFETMRDDVGIDRFMLAFEGTGDTERTVEMMQRFNAEVLEPFGVVTTGATA